MDNTFDKMFYSKGDYLAGVDESGVTDIAGPLVAACVVLPRIDPRTHSLEIFEISESKSAPKRIRKGLAEIVYKTALAIGIGEVQPAELDYLTKRQASALAMSRAVLSCKTSKNRLISPSFIIVDGEHPIPIKIEQAPIIRADEKSLCCSAASIVAKVYRDSVMERLHELYPFYGWNNNKGYYNAEHGRGLDEHGIQAGIHRTSMWPFRPGLQDEPREEWEVRRKHWKLTTLRKMVEENEKKSWTSSPRLWTPSPSFNELIQEEVRVTKSTRASKTKSEENNGPRC